MYNKYNLQFFKLFITIKNLYIIHYIDTIYITTYILYGYSYTTYTTITFKNENNIMYMYNATKIEL